MDWKRLLGCITESTMTTSLLGRYDEHRHFFTIDQQRGIVLQGFSMSNEDAR